MHLPEAAILRGRWGKWGDVLGFPAVLVCLMLTTTGLYAYNLHYSSVAFFEDSPIHADVNDALYHMTHLNFEGDNRKHLLFSATTAPLVHLLGQLPHFSEHGAAVMLLALLAGLNIVGACVLFKRLTSSTLAAVLLSCLYAVFFSNFVILSVPEPYALSNLWSLPTCCYLYPSAIP